MAVPTDMDGFSEKIGTTDTYTRLSLGDALLNYLGNTANSIECNDIGQFIDKLVPWLTCSNFKVSQKGLEIMTALVQRMKSDFRPYVPTVCTAIVDRLVNDEVLIHLNIGASQVIPHLLRQTLEKQLLSLRVVLNRVKYITSGDSHEIVREKAQAILMIFLDKEVLTPQQLFDRLGYSFTHKNSKVREETMVCLVNTINLYGSNSIALSKLTPQLVKLLADQNMNVREKAFNTLIEIYRHVGDRLRIDIQRRYASTINPSRLAPLMAKMEELRDSGAVVPVSAADGRYDDETDRPLVRTVVKKLGAKKPPSTPVTSNVVAGAVDEEYFANVFEDVPTVQIFSAQELKEQVNSIAGIISNPEADWDKRVDAFKRIRSLLIAGAATFDDFNELIKKWELPFVESLKDLRSHVVRETCVTIAYLAQTLGNKFGHVAEIVFPSLAALIQSSAKVIASAAFTAIRFIIQNVHNQRLIPIINNTLTSKSREIRKAMCDVLDQLLHTWPLPILDRRIPLLQEAVRRGVSDADNEARASARRAYWAFKGYFPEQADALLATLDHTYKRNLYGDVSLSGSNQSLNQGSLSRPATSASRNRVPGSASVTGSAENLHHGYQSSYHLHRTPSLPRSRKSGIPVKTHNPANAKRSLTPRPRSPPEMFPGTMKQEQGSSISGSNYCSPYSLRNRDRCNAARHDRGTLSVSPPPNRRNSFSVVVNNPSAITTTCYKGEAEPMHKKKENKNSSLIFNEDDIQQQLTGEFSFSLESVVDDISRHRIQKTMFIQKKGLNDGNMKKLDQKLENEMNIIGDGDMKSKEISENYVNAANVSKKLTPFTPCKESNDEPNRSSSEEQISFLKFPPELLRKNGGKARDELDNGVVMIFPPRNPKKRNRKKYTKIVEKTVIKQTTAFREFYLSPNGLKRRSRKFSRVSHDEILDIRRVKLLEKGTMTETLFESSLESTVKKEHMRKKNSNAEKEYKLKRAPKVTCFSLASPRIEKRAVQEDKLVEKSMSKIAQNSLPIDKCRPLEIVRSQKYSGRYVCSISMIRPENPDRKVIDPFWRRKDFFKRSDEFSTKSGLTVFEDVMKSSASSDVTPRDVGNGLNVTTPIIRIPINKGKRKPYREPSKNRGRCPVCKKFLQEDLSEKVPVPPEIDTCPACGISYYETELGELIDENYVRRNPELFQIVQPSTLSGEKKIISPGNRSNSAIDLQAVQRASARAQYAAMNRMKAGSGASLPRSRKSPEVTSVSSPERISRPRSRVSGYSQSQPTSRSASPSSHLSYHTYQTPPTRPRKLSGGGVSGIPGPRSSNNSRETSRETSPARHGSLLKLRGRVLSHTGSIERPPSSIKPVMTQKILQQSREAESALADALNFDESGEGARALNSRKGSSKLFDDHSDDSETSSVCSERSFDSFRRPSDSCSWSGSQSRIYKEMWNESICRDITEIIANCSRSSWSERKEGLVGLQQYLQNGNLLTPLELKRVTEIFTKMFMDSQTKVFTLFLDTLNEIIIKHQADLNDWLYVLLTKLLNKLGSDVLTSIGRKIQNTLSLVRENFSTELQMNEILRFIIDPAQTHNTKVKVAALNYLAQLASEMEPSDFNPSSYGGKDPTAAALAKMITWTKASDSKGTGEVKRAAQEAIIALFNLNTSIITMRLAKLTEEQQELASNLVQSHLRHSSSGGSGCSAPSSPAPMPLSPSRQPLLSSRNNHFEGDTIDSDEIYKSLRRTTAEIQNYSFESKLVERDRDTTSQDSGISQMSVGLGDKIEVLEERIEAISIQGNNSGHSSSLSSPTQRISLKEYNGMDKTLTCNSLDEQDCYQEGNPEEEAEAWKSVLQTFGSVGNEPLTRQQKEALTLLFRLVRQGSTVTLTQNCRKLLKILVQLLPLIDSSQSNKVVSDVVVITQVLRIITEMFKKPALSPLFADFTELLLMKVMRLFEGTHKENKEVIKYAEICCSAMAAVLPVDTTLKMLNAFAHTKEHPANMYAIKTITKVVQHRNKELIYPHLKPTMTALIEAYNSEHSPVRKSVVFCIVALHSVFGEEELTPYLEKLCPSKRKLLNLYIKRQQHGSSASNETKNNSEKD